MGLHPFWVSVAHLPGEELSGISQCPPWSQGQCGWVGVVRTSGAWPCFNQSSLIFLFIDWSFSKYFRESVLPKAFKNRV